MAKAKRVKAGTSKAEAEERRARFVVAYVGNGGNATQAAIAAGFAPKSAAVRGSELVKDRKVWGEIEKGRGALRARLQLKAEGVAEVLGGLVNARAVHMLSPRQRKQLGDLTPELEMSIVGFKFNSKGKLTEVKFADKNAAVEKAMRHLGMFAKDNGQVGKAIGRAIVVPAKQAGG